MKYWRGYLTAGIIAFFSWALMEFAAAHTVLIDMVYPYVTRMIQTFLAQWSGGADFCLWQVLVSLGIAGVLASAILMIVLRWNPVQWFGWVLTAISIVFFLHTAVYGLNAYAGPVSEDIRLEVTDYTLSELEAATTYYRDQANALADKVQRDENGDMAADFDAMAQQAGEGFETLVKEHSFSIYAGSTLPVKQLGKAKSYTSKGIAGTTIPLTGESAVNPQIPGVAMPFAMCHEMAHRMCIAMDRDADLSAYLACRVNSSVEFQYSAYFMAYRYCYNAMKGLTSADAQASAQQINAGVGDLLYKDLTTYEKFFGTKAPKLDFLGSTNDTYDDMLAEEEKTLAEAGTICDLLVSWHIQEIVLPTQVNDDGRFDPFDETQVDLTGIVNAPTTGGN